MIHIKKVDETHCKISGDPEIILQISQRYTFEVHNAKFQPKFRSGQWDGKIKLFKAASGLFPIGLHNDLIQFLYDEKILFQSDVYTATDVTDESIDAHIDSLNLPFTLFDYQVSAIKYCIQNTRGIVLSATSSGKTVLIHSIAQWYKNLGKKVLIIFPTATLVKQTKTALIEYGAEESEIHQIYAGQDKNTEQPIVLSTWQSIFEQYTEYFNQFDVVLTDECHTATAKSLSGIIDKLKKCQYKFGFTGTLDDAKCNQLQLIGSFGEIFTASTARQLIDSGNAPDLHIKIVLLKHQYQKFADYQDEINYLVSSDSRNQFITNLVKKLPGNTLVLFTLVERHGDILYKKFQNEIDKPIHFVSGKVNVDEREDIRVQFEDEDNSVILASYGTFQLGISIKKIHNIVFAAPSKSKIRTLQSIGRVLRSHKSKEIAYVYDIADDIGSNFTKNHLEERIKHYSKQQFDFNIHNHNLK